jgi:hypothetical protein
LDGRRHGGTGRDPIVHDHHRTPGDLLPGPGPTIETLPPLELT